MLVLGAATACGATTDGARAALHGATLAVDATDATYAPIYDRARTDARLSSETREELDAKIAPFDDVEKSLEVAHQSLLMLELALDAGDTDSTFERAGCVADALGRLRAGLRSVGIEPSSQLSKADATLRALASACRSRQ